MKTGLGLENGFSMKIWLRKIRWIVRDILGLMFKRKDSF
jgi:hypothetical protein